ncbi:hypothetical protein SAMN05421754_10804 [Nitrosomonas sp. Nm58]|nr:hypothetical protein SAMN05421754_10804 [Nitrosomonas sp. Nm58]
MSVNRPQDTLCFRVLQHVIPQPVVLLGTRLSQPLDVAERKMAVGIETDGDTQRIP